jgi:acetyltransferase
MQMTIDYARAEGLRMIEGQVLSENAMMLTMCRELGFGIAADPGDPSVYVVKLPIAAGEAASP